MGVKEKKYSNKIYNPSLGGVPATTRVPVF